MKTNRTMRAATLLLALTLMTSCFVGGTFAKYVTSDSATDTARVAKWGVEVMASGNLFGSDYAANNATQNADQIVATSTNVHGKNGEEAENVVAPGTKNTEGMTLSINGTPEVAYSVAYSEVTDFTNETIWLEAGTYGVLVRVDNKEVTEQNCENYYVAMQSADGGAYQKATSADAGTTYYELRDQVTVEANDDKISAEVRKYYPIEWTVTGAGSGTYRDVSQMADALKEAYNGKDAADDSKIAAAKTYDANVKIENASSTIKWAWAFEQENDGADTLLGDLMAGKQVDGTLVKVSSLYPNTCDEVLDDGKFYNLDVAFGATLTVTQVN